MNLCKIKILLFAFLIALWACKKYPEDEARSRERVIKRLTEKSWAIKEFLIDGTDYIDSTMIGISDIGQDTFSWNFLNSSFTFNKIKHDLHFREKDLGSGHLSLSKMTCTDPYISSPSTNGINWSFYSHKKEINLIAGYSYQYLSKGNWTGITFFPEMNGYWTIKKLTETEFILENTARNNGKLYRMVMEH